MATKFSRVFVVTYGRSGSTLLQGLLNAIPGYRIYGENGGFLTKLHDAYEALIDAHAHLSNPKNDNERQPWFGSSRYDTAALNARFHAFVDGILFRPQTEPDVRAFGFKEIRYHDLGEGKLASFLAFVRQIYPRAAIVFNTRRVDDVLRSGWWRTNFWPGLPKQLTDFEAFASRYAHDNPDHAFHVRYDALIESDRHEAQRLLAFLKESFSDSEIDAVFKSGHSYENRSLTEYLSGLAKHVEMTEHAWWKENVDEFRIDIETKPSSYLAKGVFLRAVGSDARVTLKAGTECIEIFSGTQSTPKIAERYPNNAGSAAAGFSIEQPLVGELQLYGASEGFESRLIGVIRPRQGDAAGRKGAPA